MKVIAFNGSPRRSWNTAILLKKALEGAASQGAATELINLYDLNFKGCISCFECKRKNGPNYGRCAVNDDLLPVLQKAATADGLILGSPIRSNRCDARFYRTAHLSLSGIRYGPLLIIRPKDPNRLYLYFWSTGRTDETNGI